MTDTLLSPEDTGEIRRPVGETRTRIDTGEATQRIDPRLIKAPSFDAIPRKVFDLDDTVIYNPQTIGVVGLDDKPHPKPPFPLPPNPKYDMAAAQPVAPWERVVDTARLSLLGSVAGVDGELRGGWVSLPPEWPEPSYVGRHRDPRDRHAIPGEKQWGRLVDAAKPQGEPRGWRVLVGVGAFVAFAGIVTAVVLAVFW